MPRQARACARHTHDRKARCVTVTPGMAMATVAEDHLQTNRMALQRVGHGCDERNAPSRTQMSPSFPLQARHKTPKACIRNPTKRGPEKSWKQRDNAHSVACTSPCLCREGGCGYARTRVCVDAYPSTRHDAHANTREPVCAYTCSHRIHCA